MCDSAIDSMRSFWCRIAVFGLYTKLLIGVLVISICASGLYYAKYVTLVFSNEATATSTETSNALAEARQEAEEEKERRRKELAERLAELDAEIEVYEGDIAKHQEAGDAYKQQIATLNSEISQIQREITSNELVIYQTNQKIEQNEEVIEFLQNKRDVQLDILAELLRDYYKETRVSVVEVVLQFESLSRFFDNLQRRDALQERMYEQVQKIKELAQNIQQEQVQLDERVEQQVLVVRSQEINRTNLSDKRQAQQVFLQQTEQTQEELEVKVEDLRKTKTQIRSQLYVLEGVGLASTFGEAYDYAKIASRITGVRPALLLAVLQRESRWGQQVGSCYLVDPEKGTGINFRVNQPRDRLLKVSRDVEPFFKIMAELGRDPYKTPISCPHPEYGYGGGMGPAQFIPSTWVGYAPRIAGILGRPADPFEIQDAMIASAVKLADAGAGAQTESAEWKAVMIYHAGGGWNNPRYRAHGDWIIKKAREYQKDIDVLES